MDIDKLLTMRPPRRAALPARVLYRLCFYLYAFGRIETPWAGVDRALYPKKLNEFHHAAECVYVHVPKTAGNSVRQILFGERLADNFVGHIFASEFRASDPESFDRYFVFATVRDPYDRLQSAFWYLKAGGLGMRDRVWARRNLGRFRTFRDFVLALREHSFREKILRFTHFIPQSRFLCDDEDRLIVKHLIRMEDFETGMAQVCAMMGVRFYPRHENQTRNRPQTVSSGQDLDLRQICRQIYALDYAVLGYP